MKILRFIWGVSQKKDKEEKEKKPRTKKQKGPRKPHPKQIQYKLEQMLKGKMKDLTIDLLFKEIKNDSELSALFEQVKKKVYRVLKKQAVGRTKLTANESAFIEYFGAIFVKNQDNKITDWTKIHSSWLVAGKYSFKQKTLKIIMKKGKGKVYVFYQVPLSKFLLLVTAPSSAGKTVWWNRTINMWQYSRGIYRGLGLAIEKKKAEAASKKKKKEGKK